MKRILIFSLNYYPRFIGGAEVAIKEITDRISESEIEFHLVTLRFDSTLPKVEKIGNVLVHRIGFTTRNPKVADLGKMPLHFNKYYFQIAAAVKAMELHSIYRYDGMWAMMAHSCGIPAGIFKFFNPKVRYLLTLQEGDPPEYIEDVMRPVFPLFRNAFTRAEYLQAISNFLLRWGRDMGFAGEAVMIPNAVDLARFGVPIPSEKVEEMRARLGKKEGDLYMVTTSRLVHKNGIDDVIRALAQLPGNVHFVIYGIGPDEEDLRRYAEDLGISDRVKFMGHIGHEEMPVALAACDIFIRPSRSEGMGNSFVEAMAAGLPVIATQEGGIADFLFDAARNSDKKPTGWAVDKDSHLQIKDAVLDIVGNPEKVREVVKEARVMVIRTYDWNIVAEDMRQLFKRMLAS